MRKQLLATSVLPMMVLAMSPVIAHAQQAAPDSAAIEEVVVTAQRREETAQRAAVPISVIGGSELTRKGIANIEALVNSIPGLKLANANVATNISLRGLPSGGSTQFSDPTIGFNYGGVPLNRLYSTSGALYDLQRVEVLKGPQGTLYGRNATVGALNMIPNRPTHEAGGSLGIDVGNYDQVKATAVLNVPLGDTLSSRLALSTNRHDGYLSNGYNDANNVAARLGVLYEPTETFSLYVWGDYYKDNSRGQQAIYRYVNPGQEYQFPSNPWFGYEPAGCGNPAICPTWADSRGPVFNAAFRGRSVDGDDGFVHLTQHIVSAEATWNLDFGTLTVIPAIVSSDLDSKTYGNGFEQRYTTKADQQSLEVRLASPPGGKLNWLIGGFYFHESVDSASLVLEANGYTQIRTPNLTDKSGAAFAQATYSLTDRLRLTGGLRYTSESKSVDGTTTLPGAFTTTTCKSPGVVLPAGSSAFGYTYPLGYCVVPNAGDLSFTDTSFKAGVEFDAGERSLLYANIGTGFKAGGFAPGLAPNTFRPEKLTAYTIGSKNRFFDNRLQVNVEGFYWNYEDQQISINRAISPAGQAAFPVNVPGYVQGIELDTVARVTQHDTVSLTLLWEEGQYDVYPTVVSSAGVIGGLTDYPRVALPQWSGTVKGEHVQPLGDLGSLTFSGDVHFESGTNLRPIVVTSLRPGDRRDAYSVGNVSVTYRTADDKYTLTGYVDNVTNEAVVSTGTTGTVGPGVYFRPATNPLDARYATLAPPRTYGLRFKASF